MSVKMHNPSNYLELESLLQLLESTLMYRRRDL